MEKSHEEIRRHVRIYGGVFIALAVLTIVTVTISSWRLALIPAVAAALTIASIKGSLVAGFFMHLSSEKKIIFAILGLTAIFFLVLLIIPSLR